MIKTIHNEASRGCGKRKPGGMYLMSEGAWMPCGRLPMPCVTCPTCGHGIKFSRGFSWVDPSELFKDTECKDKGKAHCKACNLRELPTKAGLIWIGEQHYKTTEAYMQEAIKQGISRRISMIPKELEVGKTVVMLAHRKAIKETCGSCKGAGISGATKIMDAKNADDCDECKGTGITHVPAVFTSFVPQRIEYILMGNETDEEIERLEARGITPVRLEYDDPEDNEDDE